MADYQQKDMSGALFRNEQKQDGDDYPDYQGSVTVKGVKYGVGGWIKKSKSGKTYMSLSVRPWQEKQTKSQDETSERIPF